MAESRGEDGSDPPIGNDPFNQDGSEDQDLAMALRVSMEEQRARDAPQLTSGNTNLQVSEPNVFAEVVREGNAPTRPETAAGQNTDVHTMSDDEQLAHAIRLSMLESNPPPGEGEPMDTDEPPK